MLQCDSQATFQVNPSFRLAQCHSCRAEVIECVTENVLMGAVVQQFDRSARPLHGGDRCVREHVELRTIAVSHCEFRTDRQRLKDLDRLSGKSLGSLSTPSKPTQSREPAQCVPFLPALTQITPDRKCRGT